MSITLGSDPEFMLNDTDGVLRSAIGIIEGSKEERLNIGGDHAIYFDNVLAECNVRPEGTKSDVVESFRDCLQRFTDKIRPFQLVAQASAEYPDGECEHEEAKKFGCDPEFCAYRVSVIEPPECENTFRSAGGHIHIGFDGGKDVEDEELNFVIAWNRLWVIRMCDLFLGIPSLFLDKDPTSKARRNLYGLAGSHRCCEKYGVEYRTLGNFWLSRPSLVELIYDLSDCCVRIVMDDRVHEHIWENEINPEDIRGSINTWNTKKANKYFKVIKKYVPKSVMEHLLREMDRKGVSDLYKEWELKS